MLCICMLSVACNRQRCAVCGVSVEGTPWELAAAIHDKGNGTFVPVSVEEFSTKAYIHGYTLPDEQPTQVVCDVKEGKVVWAVMERETNEKQ